MAGISSSALKGVNYPENRKKYNGIEFTQDLDLNAYDAFYRTLDPQTGRWWQVDPKVDNMEAWSPYASMFDNPIKYSDQLGDEPGDDPPGWRKVLASVLGTINGLERSAGLRGVDASAFPFTDTEAQIYNGASTVGQVGGTVMFTTRPGSGNMGEPTPVPVGVGEIQVIPAGAKAPAGTMVFPLPPAESNRNAKGDNILKPDKDAKGDAPDQNGSKNYDHSTFKRDDNGPGGPGTGNIYKYEEWKGNERNPNGYDTQKRFDGGKPDGSAGSPHKTKQGQDIPTPHVQGRGVPQGARAPTPNELPNNSRFIRPGGIII